MRLADSGVIAPGWEGPNSIPSHVEQMRCTIYSVGSVWPVGVGFEAIQFANEAGRQWCDIPGLGGTQLYSIPC